MPSRASRMLPQGRAKSLAIRRARLADEETGDESRISPVTLQYRQFADSRSDPEESMQRQSLLKQILIRGFSDLGS
jgi:hypothetical protein